jgi:hypothetical protein
MSRTGASSLNYYKDGVSLGDAGTSSTGRATHNFHLMSYDVDGSPSTYSTRQIRAWTIGAGLTGTQASNLATRLNTLMTSLGINAY